LAFLELDKFHDSSLVLIDASDLPKELVLQFKTETGVSIKVILSGCEIFRINDFTLQNIVSRFLVYNGKTIDKNDVICKLNWAANFSDAPNSLDEKTLSKLINSIKSDKLSMVYLEPSWGGELVAVCETIQTQYLQT
jgi:hypothetical protein